MLGFKQTRETNVIRVGRASTFISSGQILERMAGHLLEKEENVPVNYIGFQGGSELIKALYRKEVDVGNVWSSFLFSAISENARMKAIVRGSWGASEFLMIARRDIKTIADLKGRKIAHHGTKTLTETCIRLVLSKEGLTLADVDSIVLPNTDKRMTVLLSGQIDATLLWSERAYELVGEHPDFHILGSMIDYIPMIDGYYFFVRNDFLERNDEKAYMWAKYIVRSARHLYEMTAEEIANFALREYIPAIYDCGMQELSATFSRYLINREWDENGGMTKKSFEATMAFFLRTGMIEKRIFFEQACNRSILDRVLEELNEV